MSVENHFPNIDFPVECKNCDYPIHEGDGSVHAVDDWHIECYEEEHGPLPDPGYDY